MAIQPGTYNFTMQRRADFSLQLIFKDGNNEFEFELPASKRKITFKVLAQQDENEMIL